MMAGTHLNHADTVAHTVGKHGFDKPAIVIDLAEVECECESSHFATTSSGREQGGAASSIETSTCTEEGQVYWMISVRGLRAVFYYEVEFDWSLEPLAGIP